MVKNKDKNYIIITTSISNLGGAQLYVLRRAKYLIYKGYSVKLIVSTHNSENFILEDKFAEIPILYLNQIQNPISFYNKNSIESIVCTVQLFLKDYNNGIIESSTLQGAIWGELISSMLKLKHIIYLLSEQPAYTYNYYPGINFFNYKLKRGELYATTEYSLPLIFGRQIDETKNNFINVAFDPNELVPLSQPSLLSLNIDLNAFIIGTVTRIDKPYLEIFIKACIRFAEKHVNKKFIVIIAGGSENINTLNHLKASYNGPKLNNSNLDILFTGYITELGKDLFSLLNVFVGQGTAAINAISQGCATLIIDPSSNQCSGIFGIDIDNFGYPKNGIIFPIEEKIESLMLDNELLIQAKIKGVELFQKQYSIDSCFNKIDEFIMTSHNDASYYPFNISKLQLIKDKLKFKISDIKIILARSYLHKLLQKQF